MKHLSLLLCIMIASLFSFSQVENYDLSKYKLPDIKRQQIDFSFQSSGQNSSAKSFYDHENIRDTFKLEDGQYSGNYYLGYSYYQNSQRVQSSISAYTYGNYNKTKQNTTNYYSQDYYDFDNHLSFNYDIKYFFTPTNWFVTTAPRFNINNSKHKNNETNYNWKDLTTNGYLEIGAGKGRIEQVQDFRHAILLIQEFDKRGISKRNVSEAEMVELSTLISQLKNRRFFDSRKQKEAELVALDSFLVDKGIVDEKSIQYFIGLEDIWVFGGLQIRESGKQVLFSITPGYYLSKIYDDSENNTNENISIQYKLSYVSKNPISLKWQGNYDFNISHRYLNRLQQQNINGVDKSYENQAFANGQVGYYPNTRTYFDLSGMLALFNLSDENILDKEKYSAGLRIVTSGYYYISEKLRLGYSIGFERNKYGIFNNDIENTHYKTFNYNLNLNYAIF